MEKVQCIVYRINGGNVEILLLKTIPGRGGFWQSVTGKVEPGESLCDAARRELHEETGIDTLGMDAEKSSPSVFLKIETNTMSMCSSSKLILNRQ